MLGISKDPAAAVPLVTQKGSGVIASTGLSKKKDRERLTDGTI
jgi:hypothetical protein